MALYRLYTIEFKNDVVNRGDVVGWNIETGEAGVWSGLFGNKAFFLLRSDAVRFMKTLHSKGIDTDCMTVVNM